MRNSLLATTALAIAGALAAGPAAADEEKLSVSVGGYMEQWFGYADRNDDSDGGLDTQSDSEIYFTGSLESDSGLTFGVDIQLEGNNGPKEYTHPATGANNQGTGSTNIDESYAWVSGAFGKLEIGARDTMPARLHTGIKDAGVGINAGDTHKWIPGGYHDTNGWWVGMGDNKNINYITPRVSGVQVGLSYGPDTANENKWPGEPRGTENSVWGIGFNFQQDIDGTSFAFSVGHRTAENSSATFDLDMDNDAADMRHTAAMKAMDDKMKARDNDTLTNIGVSVGFGAFTFSVAYADRDRNMVSSECRLNDDATALTAKDATEDAAALTAVEPGDVVPCDRTGVVLAGSTTINASDGMEKDATGVNAMHMFVENKAGAWETYGASVVYTDGPMSLSLAHMVMDVADSSERTATMLSAAYTLAPGVAWRSSIFTVEDDTGFNLGGEGARQDVNEGTAFVTGIRLDF